MIVDEGKHYLYRHIRLDTNEVFYIGIGTKRSDRDNDFYRRAHRKSDRNKWWKNIVKKTEYKVDILLESDNCDFIKEKEIEFITLYGRKDLGLGTLVNMTNGGDGLFNYIPTEETKTKLRGQKRSVEIRNKISETRKGITPSLETKKKMSEAQMGSKHHFYGKKHTDEWKIKVGKRCLFINIQTNKQYIFNTLTDGAKSFNLNSASCSKVASGQYNQTGGFKISYL